MKTELVTPSVSNSNCSLRIYNGKKAAESELICDWHIHYEVEIFLLCSGTKYFYVDDDEIQLRPGDIIFINSRIPHKTKTPIGSLGILLQFRVDLNTDDNKEYLFVQNILEINTVSYKLFESKNSINEQLTACIKKISNEYLTKQEFYDYYIKSYIYEITAILYRNGILTNRGDLLSNFSNLIPALEYIEKHYRERITLRQISDVLNFNESYFCRVFKNALGVSFVEYMNLVRIYKAKELMKNSAKNITQISFEVGFSSVAYFIKIFKKYNFHTPNKYKKLLQ